jgi:hypothetical protein
MQIIMGIVTGAGIWLSIWVAGLFPENRFLGYLFLIVFVVALVIQRRVEKNIGKPLKLYFKSYIISLIVGLGLFLIYGFTSGVTFFAS